MTIEQREVIIKDLEIESLPADSMLICDFETKIKNGFVKRVYSLLSISVLITFGIVLFFSLYDDASKWLIRNYWVSVVFSLCSFILIIIFSCCPSIAKNHYIGVTLLLLLSLFFGISISGIAVCVNKFSVLLACGITVLVFLVLTIFSIQVKFDFTGWGPYLLIGVLIILIYSIILIFIPRNNIAYIILGALGVIIFSFYIIYDTQLIIGGKHRKHQFSIDEYIFATISLYLDIVNVFTYILMIINSIDR
ncbi:N-methyl-D-aspartate receptor-associated protein [Cryptosporidium ubiquitum]|uniref:N-methyl-D-aspartate receptor-associated protein n=1 Tax=Cryptosporidium ubiquitum TaxID=857276 RepID=A0A1J4MDN4_9CRYT|nr:N-methyl-D-aspartate receptor-associated protein [Cryptosporidium ubiquitum]OII72095.1 N-methyl-D-aspartate receptor-associated protein [Cryptosporidium ubiquitum]